MTNTLTPDEVSALQGRELDAEVAQWMGWTLVDKYIGSPGYPSAIVEIPFYSSDISAMYGVEYEIQKRGLTEPYIEALSQVIAPEYASIFNSAIELDRHGVDINGHDFLWRMAHATPEQRARAVVLMAQEIAAQDRLRHQMSDHAMGARGGE